MTTTVQGSPARPQSDASVTRTELPRPAVEGSVARGSVLLEPPRRMPQDQLHGSSYAWWPPRRDHVLLHKANPVRFAYLDRFVAGWRQVRVLDVGCGGGYTCEFLAERGATVSGTDLLPEALREAREHAERTGLAIDYRRCTQAQLPHRDREMEVVTCFDVLEHVEDKTTLLSEIHRVLRPEGVFLFDTLNQSWWAKLCVIWLGEHITRLLPSGTHDWQHFCTPQALQALLEACGFDVLAIAGISLDPRPLVRAGLPIRVDPDGNRSIWYLGAARPRRTSSSRPQP